MEEKRMKKKKIKDKSEKIKVEEIIVEIPLFYSVSQKRKARNMVKLFPKPIYATKRRALQEGLNRILYEGLLVEIEVKPLEMEEKAMMMMEATEEELLQFTK